MSKVIAGLEKRNLNVLKIHKRRKFCFEKVFAHFFWSIAAHSLALIKAFEFFFPVQTPMRENSFDISLKAAFPLKLQFQPQVVTYRSQIALKKRKVI